jgi:hypothetical protein
MRLLGACISRSLVVGQGLPGKCGEREKGDVVEGGERFLLDRAKPRPNPV